MHVSTRSREIRPIRPPWLMGFTHEIPLVLLRRSSSSSWFLCSSTPLCKSFNLRRLFWSSCLLSSVLSAPCDSSSLRFVSHVHWLRSCTYTFGACGTEILDHLHLGDLHSLVSNDLGSLCFIRVVIAESSCAPTGCSVAPDQLSTLRYRS